MTELILSALEDFHRVYKVNLTNLEIFTAGVAAGRHIQTELADNTAIKCVSEFGNALGLH